MASNPDPRISDISHLFLSSVRDKASNGQPAPTRKPPGSFAQEPSPSESIDMTPEEFAGVLGTDEEPPFRQVAAIIASHLAPAHTENVLAFARARCKAIGRTGLIEIDSAEMRLRLLESGDAGGDSEPAAVAFDARVVAESLSELDCDVAEWLVSVPSPRLREPRDLLRTIGRWVVLTGADHDSVVATYRMIKGLSDLPAPTGGAGEAKPPKLSLAVIGASGEEADRVYKKLSSVCQQFLGCALDREKIEPADDVAVYDVLTCNAVEKAAGGAWQVIGEFLGNASSAEAAMESVTSAKLAAPAAVVMPVASSAEAKLIEPIPAIADAEPVQAESSAMKISLAAERRPSTVDPADEVIDLPGDASVADVVAAVMKADVSRIACPISPPMCPAAKLCVTRDRRLTLVAAASVGLGELRAIAGAYRWMNENRELLAMAMPQFAIEAKSAAGLDLLVDRSDSSSELLGAMTGNAQIVVKSYRRLRWGGRTGLLLEAA